MPKTRKSAQKPAKAAGMTARDVPRNVLAVCWTTTKARSSLSELVSRVVFRGERVVLSRRGKPAAAIVPLEDLELLEELEGRMDLDAARKALAEAKEKGTTSWEKLKAELGV